MKHQLFIFLCLMFQFSFAQGSDKKFKWLRTGFIYGYASQNQFIMQDSDYRYENNSFKWSNHFNLITKNKHAWELLIEPTYYRSKHESFNEWQDYFTSVDNPEEMRAALMPFKTINEYALNLGVIYRYFISPQASLYAYLNVGPMYIDTETERLKKGFAFSDILAVGYQYKISHIAIDFKTYFRHASNANFQWPNYGLNSIGFELGVYYEFIRN